MNLQALAHHVGAVLLTPDLPLDQPVERVWAGDRMSDLITAAGPGTLIVTNLGGLQVLRAVGLMEAAAVCFAQGVALEPDVVAAAAARRTVLLASPTPLFETCGMLYECLRAASEADGAPAPAGRE